VSQAIDHHREARSRAFILSSVLLDAVTKAGLPPGWLASAESITLLQALAAVPDPSNARGIITACDRCCLSAYDLTCRSADD
jgi:hypothetical protein